MTRDLRIRSAAAGEWPDIARVLEQCGIDTADTKPEVHLCHVAVLHEQLVGSAAGERYGDSLVVRWVAVLPDYRERGIASHLVSALLMRARANACRQAVLMSAVSPGHFARYGFTLISADRLPAEVLASGEFARRGSPPPLCMVCTLN